MHKVILSLGGNIGNKKMNFQKAVQLIEREIGEILDKSSIYETPHWGFESEDNFWNQVIVCQTSLLPFDVLDKINSIEDHFGRQRIKGRYTSREMDIDILYFANVCVESEELIIPHPLISERKFVLVPLQEITPDFKHPINGLTNRQMLKDCNDISIIKKIIFD